MIRGFLPTWRITPGHQLKARSFRPFPLFFQVCVRGQLIKLYLKARGKALSPSVCHQLKALLSALELTDASEAGLKEATAGSVLRALCGEGARRAPGSSAPRDIHPFILGELRAARGTRSRAAFPEYPEARQAPRAGSRVSPSPRRRLPISRAATHLACPVCLQHHARVPAGLLGKVPDHRSPPWHL